MEEEVDFSVKPPQKKKTKGKHRTRLQWRCLETGPPARCRAIQKGIDKERGQSKEMPKWYQRGEEQDAYLLQSLDLITTAPYSPDCNHSTRSDCPDKLNTDAYSSSCCIDAHSHPTHSSVGFYWLVSLPSPPYTFRDRRCTTSSGHCNFRASWIEKDTTGSDKMGVLSEHTTWPDQRCSLTATRLLSAVATASSCVKV